jgi:hypothetical protein
VRGVLECPLRARAGAEPDVALPEVRQHRDGVHAMAERQGLHDVAPRGPWMLGQRCGTAAHDQPSIAGLPLWWSG